VELQSLGLGQTQRRGQVPTAAQGQGDSQATLFFDDGLKQ